MGIDEQYRNVRAEVDRVCLECGRNPSDVLLVAVSKTVGVADVQPVVDAGALDFGENRPDELLAKQAVYPQAHWHFIGNLQSRRIKDVVGKSCLIHSVCKLDHLPRIEKAAAALGIVQDILLEVNSGEEAKGGISASEAPAFVEAVAACEHVRLRGLMTMAPQGDEDAARQSFRALSRLREQLEETGVLPNGSLEHLSMGMSEDWPIAVSEGATMIRIGRAVFSQAFSLK